MMKMKRLRALTLALVLAFSTLSGCGSPPPGSASGAGGSGAESSAQMEAMDLTGITDPYLAVSGLAGDTVVARLGDEDIHASLLLYWLALYGGLDEALDVASLHSQIHLLARQEGLTPAASIAQELEQIYASLADQVGDEGLVDYVLWSKMLDRNQLAYFHESVDLLGQLRELYYGENSDGYPTDAEVNAYLDERGCFRVKHILLMTVDQSTLEPLDESEIAQKKATIDDLLAQLRAAEDPIALFDQLMNEYSEDGGLLTNPDGYIFDDTDSLVGGFREATLALAVGEISDVVETGYGYHIMLRLPIDPADYRDECVTYLLETRIDGERERLGVTRTAEFDKLNVDSFWTNMLSLQSAVQAKLAE